MKLCTHKRDLGLQQGKRRAGQGLSSRGLIWCWLLGEVGDSEAWGFVTIILYYTPASFKATPEKKLLFSEFTLASLGFLIKFFYENIMEASLICGLGEYICCLIFSPACF